MLSRLLVTCFALGLPLLMLAGCERAEAPAVPPVDPAAEEAAIRALLQEQVSAWNEGSLRGFMAGYARTDSLRFASGGEVRWGWETALEAYERGYPDRTAMGTLRFDSLDVRVLAPRWAVTFGRWQLRREQDAPWGWFTLLLEKQPEGWRIVHDHTSSGG